MTGSYLDGVGLIALNNGQITGTGGILFSFAATGCDVDWYLGDFCGESYSAVTRRNLRNEYRQRYADDPNGIEGSTPGQLLNKTGSGQLILGGTSGHSGGSTVNGGILTVNGVHTGSITVNPNGTLGGSGTIGGGVSGGGRVAPGNSPGILTINGDYTQSDSSTLEIQVGGWMPGNNSNNHDQVRVGGNVILGGHYEFPLVNGFVPHSGDTITFIDTFGTGSIQPGTRPLLATAPNLASADSNLAIHVVANTGVGGNVQLQYVPKTQIFFDSNGTAADWFVSQTNNPNWDQNRDPKDTDNTMVTNVLGIPQTVVVSTNPSDTTNKVAAINNLTVGDTLNSSAVPVTVSVDTGFELHSQVGGVKIAGGGSIELHDASLTAQAQTIQVQNGGLLAGRGTIQAADLVVSNGTLRPGFSVGHLDVQGNYTQGANGTMLIDVNSMSQYDTVSITGNVQLGGTLQINAAGLGSIPVGTMFPIITAGGATAASFDKIYTTAGGIYFIAKTMGPITYAVSEDRGDMNGVNGIDPTDADLFAYALITHGSITKYGDKCQCDVDPQQGADFNGNGRIDFGDIPDFQKLLTAHGVSQDELGRAIAYYQAAVPEPGGALLCLIGLAFGSIRYRVCRSR